MSGKKYSSKPKLKEECLNSVDLQPLSFPCVFKGCQEQFSVRKMLNQHVRKHWKSDQDRRCKTCGRENFISSGDMIRHVWSCSNVRPYICPFRGCDSDANQRWNLQVHLLSMHKFSDCLPDTLR